MLETLGEKARERTALRQHVEMRTLVEMKPQRAAVGRPPVVVQIHDKGQDARRRIRTIGREAVAVTRIERTGWVDRVVRLEIPQPEIERRIDALAQKSERTDERPLGSRRRRFVEPQDSIAAIVGPLGPRIAAPDTGRPKRALRVARNRMLAQRTRNIRRDEAGNDREPARCQRPDIHRGYHKRIDHQETAMRIVITGGAGFLGQRLARAILARRALTDAHGHARDVSEIVLLDVASAPRIDDARVREIAGDLADPAVIERAITADTASVFHLAAVVSGQAEAEFDVGMRVNVDATRTLLEHCRTLSSPPKFVFASSLAVFGGKLPDPVPDDAPITPQSSYGTQKAISELLVHDMSRKGMIDGRSLRLPTVTVRPGKPNKAASSFASGVIREPLAGVDAICPVAPETAMWVTSPRTVIDNLIVGHEADGSGFGPLRAVNVPGFSVSAGEMVAALRRVAGEAVAARVKWQHDPAIARIVSTWPARFESVRGRTLGMRADTDFETVVREYVADEMAKP